MRYFDKIIQYATLVFIFLIPWQARWIISVGQINGGAWEYGTQSVYATEVLLAVILVSVVIKWIVEAAAARRLGKKKETPQRGRLYRSESAILLFLIYAGLSIFWSIDKNTALIHWRWLVELGAVFALASMVRTRHALSLRKIEHVIILSAVLQAIWGIGQWLMQSIPASTILGMAQQSADVLGASVVETLDGRWLRAYGSFPHPNMLGAWLVLGLIILVRRCCLDPQGEAPYTGFNKYKRFLPRGYGVETTVNYALFAIILFGLLTTFSRSAWLAFGAFFIFWFFREVSNCHSGLACPPNWRDPESRSKKRNWIPACAGMTIILLIVSIFVVLFPQPFLTRLNNTSRLEYRSTSERQASLAEGWEIIKKHPLIGVGVGNYGLAVHRDIDSTKPSYYYQPMHNVFLLIWAELGAVGLFLILLIMLLSLPRICGATAAILSSPRKPLSLKTMSNALSGLLRPLLRPRNDMVFILPLLIISLFDHYIWSFYSGLMIGAVYLANISRK